MKVLVVFNPVAGRSALEALHDALRLHFGAASIAYELLETQAGQSPDERVRQAVAAGCEMVIAAGGDGTVAGAINGIAGTEVPLGIIPMGTGNLVARELDIPLDVDQAVALLAGTPVRRRIDAMRIAGRVYVLNASVGLSASVVRDTSAADKSRFGRGAYVGTAILKIFRFRARRLKVVVDGHKNKPLAVEVVVLNCGRLAGRLYPKGPDIRADDGRLDVWIVRVRNLLDFPRYFLDVLLGLSGRPLAYHLPARKAVTISSRIPRAVQADGDVIGTTPVTIELLRSAVTVLVPPGAPAPRNG